MVQTVFERDKSVEKPLTLLNTMTTDSSESPPELDSSFIELWV